jgi:hypothetical protein
MESSENKECMYKACNKMGKKVGKGKGRPQLLGEIKPEAAHQS